MLSRIDVFEGLSQNELSALAACAIPRTYAPGEDLFYEGEPCGGLHIILGGAVKVVKTTPNGRQLVLTVQQAPSTVAEVPVFDGGPNPATVTAMTRVDSLVVLRNDLYSFLRRNPSLALRFLEVFGARLRTLVTLVERITFGNVRQRLAAMLVEFSEASGKRHFQLPETHEQIASRLGTVREVVSRNLGRFQNEGLIRVARKDVEILDRAGLATEAATEM
ncbi:MAG TPA: Crp/Fnr family transcriptional regulator [Bryobacteraceae bacterium]|nr:Crp/Fnr family transcriptional regulator [Bryobacteraceae bacterium]HPT28865.1 Crp/Fnr family transcriptional regulator [Bryobacteraceae bacterium]